MSIDLLLRSSKKPSSKQIEEVIKPLGWHREVFVKGYHNPSYRWFQTKNHESTRGCWLFIYAPESTGLDTARTVFHAYSNAGRSYEDLEAQNNVIRALRQKFTGSLENSETGKNSYLPNDITRLSPAEKACGYAYLHFQHNLGRASMSIQDIDKQHIKLSKLMPYAFTMHPGVVRNNILLPFLVAILEALLKDFFIAYIDSHPAIQDRIYEKKSKVDYVVLKQLMKNEKTIAQIESSEYSFQNLLSAHTAYRNYIGIDLFQILNRRIKFEKRFYVIRNVLQEMISLRHDVIHGANVHIHLDKNQICLYLNVLERFGASFENIFLKGKNFKFNLERWI